MTTREPKTITRAVNALAATGDRPPEEVFTLIYRELKRLADKEMRRESSRKTLDTTMLVHEAFVRLTENGSGPWESRWHFYASAARSMRRILVDAARRRAAGKRAIDKLASNNDSHNGDAALQPDLLALDDALIELEAFAPRYAEVVMLRYFAGLSTKQIADLLDVDERTVYRDWRCAKAWLYRKLATDLESQSD